MFGGHASWDKDEVVVAHLALAISIMICARGRGSRAGEKEVYKVYERGME